MTHIDDETLSLVALNAADLSADERRHLDGCAACQGEVEALGRIVDLGRESQGVALETPSPAVWDRIRADIADGDPVAVGVPSVSVAAQPVAQSEAQHLAPRRRAARAKRVHRVRLAVWIPVTAVIAIAAAVGGFVASPSLRPTTVSASTVVERADLDALPGWTGAHGTATLTRSAGGKLSLTIDMTPGSAQPATVAGPLREVWLMKPDLSGLMSMGFLTASSGTFSVPDGIDVSTYGLVDISAQAANGNPGHSGQSIMRGTLSRAG